MGVLIGWHCAKVQGHAELERYDYAGSHRLAP